MKQITEDYVSYEIAVLLKEKGFTQFTNMGYMEGVLTNVSVFQVEHNPDRFEAYAYTHQMALKWLRENNLYIEIRRSLNTFYYGWKVEQGISEKATFDYKYDFYEQAVEAAILYVLKNLI